MDGSTPTRRPAGSQPNGAATLDQTRRRAVEVMAGYRRPWWVAGGWALDLLLGRKTRPHADLEISMLAGDQQALFDHLRGWDLRLAAPGQSFPQWDGSRIQSPFHQVWARRGPGRTSGAEEFAADPTMLGFLLEQGSTDRWVFRRHPAITRPLHQLGRTTADGVPFVAPEVALLFKAKLPRFKDQRDFDRVLPHLDGPARAWLAWALEQAYPGNPWRARI
jgi:Aminoglycoside-2''-adenylyltransferase